jgi:hypothetical protein
MSEEATQTVEISLNGIEAYYLNNAINTEIDRLRKCYGCQCSECEQARRRVDYLNGIRGKFIQFLFEANEQDEWPAPAPHVNPILKPRNAVEAAAFV